MSREHIECDACDKPNATKRCSNCKLVFYCSAKCQRSHWPQHKPDCRSFHQSLAAELAYRTAPEAPDAQVPPQTTETCGICLERLNQPVTLEGCGHMFCHSCLRNYQNFSPNATCPFCRAQLPDVDQHSLDRASMHTARAQKISGAEKQAQCELALAEVQKILDVDPTDLRAGHMRAEILLIAGDAESAVTAFKAVLELNSSNQNVQDERRQILAQADAAFAAGDEEEADRLMTMLEQGGAPPKVFAGGKQGLLETKLKLAAAQQDTADWEAAMELYMSIVRDMGDDHTYGGPKLQLKLWMGMTRVFFETGEYERAICGPGSMGIAMNRHYPGVHKYVALSEKASGDLTAAIRTASRAVLYEAPWDPDNKAENHALLNDLIAQRDESGSVTA